MTTNYTPVLFDKENTDYLNHLEEHGYIVIKDILNKSQQENSYKLFLQSLNKVSKNFDINNSETWTINNTPIMWGKGIGVFNGFGQSDFVWDLRTNTNIQNIFKKIHNCEELVSSCDGFSLFVSNKQKSDNWLHIDQNPINKVYSIQGAYNLFSVTENDSGFICVPKSHKTFKPTVNHKKDWVICENQKEVFEKSVKLLIPENCLLLWNSKLIHSNIGIKKNHTINKINRVTVYLCFMNKNTRSEIIRQKKIEAYKNGKATSHWPNKCELKQYPFGYKKKYLSRNFEDIKSKLDLQGNIPSERLNLL